MDNADNLRKKSRDKSLMSLPPSRILDYAAYDDSYIVTTVEMH